MTKAKNPSVKSQGNVKTVQQSAKSKGESKFGTDFFISSPPIRPEDMAKLNLRRR